MLSAKSSLLKALQQNLSRQKLSKKRAFGRELLAESFWRRAFGRELLAESFWQRAFCREHLAESFWQRAFGGELLAESFWRRAFVREYLAESFLHRAFGRWLMVEISPGVFYQPKSPCHFLANPKSPHHFLPKFQNMVLIPSMHNLIVNHILWIIYCESPIVNHILSTDLKLI